MNSAVRSTLDPSGFQEVVDVAKQVTLHSLTLGECWEREKASGLWRLGDVCIALVDGDPTRFTISRVGGEALLNGTIYPPRLGNRDFEQFVWLLETLAGRPFPTAGLKPWFDEAQRLASAAYAERDAERRWIEPPPTLEQRLYKPDATVRSRLNVVDLGELMRKGPTRPRVLVPDRIVAGVHHSFFGPPECAKTWILGDCIGALIKEGKNVVWVDWEMGGEAVAQRLLDLGADPEDVSKHLTYLDAPDKDGTSASRSDWAELMDEVRPVLVVWDSFTEALSAAGLDDNKATDIGRWQGWYLDAARKVGAATVTLDHTGHADAGRARGSGHKRAAAKVEWEIKKLRKFDNDSVGLVEMTLRKNSLSADLPKSQLIEIGAEDGQFILRPTNVAPPAASGGNSPANPVRGLNETRRLEITKRIIERLQNAPGRRLTQNQLTNLVTGRSADIITVAKELADPSSGTRVRSRAEGRSIVYELEPKSTDGSQG
jgi:AAA domain-containing protein